MLLEILTTIPFFIFNFCCKNSGSLTFPTKHRPCESFFSAVTRSCSLAINLTSFLPPEISKFTPLVLGGLGALILNGQSPQENDDPALDRFKDKD